MYIPLLILSYFMGTLLVCLICMICVFIFKHFFYYALHLNKWYCCFALSYSLFIILTLIYRGLGTLVPLMSNQPMLLVILCVLVAYGNHYAGYWQKKLCGKTIWEMNEQELRKYCKLKGIKRERIDFVVYVVIHQWTFPEIATKLGFAVDTLKDWSAICKDKLGIKNWDADKN